MYKYFNLIRMLLVTSYLLDVDDNVYEDINDLSMYNLINNPNNSTHNNKKTSKPKVQFSKSNNQKIKYKKNKCRKYNRKRINRFYR